MPTNRTERTVRLVALAALAVPLLSLLLTPVAQPPAYHNFADQRTLAAIPHAANVLSNLPLLAVGIWGLWVVTHGVRRRSMFVDPAGALPYALLFGGVTLTAFGSAAYHWQPNDATLVWDRLPIALGFAGLTAGVLGDRAPASAPMLSLACALLAVATVAWWATTANLLPYLAMQAAFLAATLFAVARLPAQHSHANRIAAALALYALAIVFEAADHATFAALGGTISGHTVKHLLGAAAIAVVAQMLRRRTAVA